MRCRHWLPLVSVLISTYWSYAQTEKPSGPLTVEEVVRLCKAGLSDDLVITKIKKSGKAFDLSPDELIELRKTGLSDLVIKYLLDPSQPYTPVPPSPDPRLKSEPPPAAPPPNPAPKYYPSDPSAAVIPAEPGVYYIVDGSPARIDIRVLLGAQESPGLGKVLLKKGKAIGYLAGSSSKTVIANPVPVFYVRLPEGKAMEDLTLLALDRKSDRREIEMGPAGPKPELKAETIRQFESLEVGPRLFRAAPSKLIKGEYMFYLLGSAEPPKGSFGKGYDFRIEEPSTPRKK